MEIENHMVANTPDAPWNRPDDNRRYESCGICGSIMIRSDKDWQYPWVNEDENDLTHAGAVPGAYVCSLSCRSQALYNASGPEQRKALETLVAHWEEMATALHTLGIKEFHTPAPPANLLNPFFTDMEPDGNADYEDFHRLYSGCDAIYELLVTDDPPAWVLALSPRAIAIHEEEKREEGLNNGQFGVGA